MTFRKILISLTLLTLLIPASISARIVDKIIAVVNEEVITQSEVDRLLYPIFMQYAKIYQAEEELYKKLDESRIDILKQLINDKLILSEAKKREIKAEEREIDEQVESVKKDLASRGMDFNSMLKEQNFTLSDLREKYRDQIMIRKTIESEITSRINILPSEISNYYTSHIEDYTQPEQVAAYTIFIRLKSERTPLESRQLADDVHKMLLDGSDFEALAGNYSEGPHREDGGDLGYIKRGQLLKEIDNVIFFLKVGEVSDVIETPVGYHIFKVYDRKDEKVLSYEEVHQKVKEMLYRIKAQKRLEEWLEKLKSNAYISIK